MPTKKRVKPYRAIVDLLVVDREDRPILIGEVKSKPLPEPMALEQLEHYVVLAALTVPFLMIADPEHIHGGGGDDQAEDQGLGGSTTREIEG